MPFQRIEDDLFRWTDICNVYVLKDGNAALLIDLGDGSVLDHLGDIGVERVEWVLFTHHHREQCQGAPRLKDRGVKIAVPEAERAFFERPESFRKMRPTLTDAFTVYGSSYVRPPVEPIPIDHGFKRMDDFTWRGRELWCVETRGNSPGSMSYLLKKDKRWRAFSGDVMLADARMHNWFDSEWDYGYAAGLYALFSSAVLLHSYDLELLLPSHGPTIPTPSRQLEDYQKKLRQLSQLLLRGYEAHTFAGAAQDTVSKPTAVPHIWQVSQHLFKFKGPNYWPNFHLLLADNGHGLVVDCGLFDKEFLDKSITLMQQRLGLKKIDAVVVTHMHGDHCQEAPHMRTRWGAQLWTLDRVVDKCRYPERFDYVAPIQTYGKGIDSIAFDRILRDGETVRWEGYELTADWMPGQTEFALCLHGMIDGRKVAFTGDNLFASATDPAQTGHEALVARNSGILEEGYLYAASYLHGLQPDLILGGHSWAIDHPQELIERYRTWALKMREALRGVSTDKDYRYHFDPFWVRAEPYRVTVRPGETATVQLHVRNFRDRAQTHRIVIHPPPGVRAEPTKLEGEVGAEWTGKFSFRLNVAAGTKEGVYLVALDTTLDGKRYGEWFDFMLQVG